MGTKPQRQEATPNELPAMPDKPKEVVLAEKLLAQRVRVKEAAALAKEMGQELCEAMGLANIEQFVAQTPDGENVLVVHSFREGISFKSIK